MLNSQASLDSGSRSGWRLWLGLGGVRAFSFDGLWYFAISRKVNWGTVSLSSNSLFIICGHYGYLRIFSLRDTVTVRLSKQGKVGPEVGTHIPADKLNRYLEMYHSLLPGIISIRGWKKTSNFNILACKSFWGRWDEAVRGITNGKNWAVSGPRSLMEAISISCQEFWKINRIISIGLGKSNSSLACMQYLLYLRSDCWLSTCLWEKKKIPFSMVGLHSVIFAGLAPCESFSSW